MKFKQGVEVDNLLPAMWPDLCRLDRAWREQYGYDLMVTSGRDGKHSARTSDHYRGGAIDCRTWTTETSGVQMNNIERGKAFRLVKRELGQDWFVKSEADHIHASYRPEYNED